MQEGEGGERTSTPNRIGKALPHTTGIIWKIILRPFPLCSVLITNQNLSISSRDWKKKNQMIDRETKMTNKTEKSSTGSG